MSGRLDGQVALVTGVGGGSDGRSGRRWVVVEDLLTLRLREPPQG